MRWNLHRGGCRVANDTGQVSSETHPRHHHPLARNPPPLIVVSRERSISRRLVPRVALTTGLRGLGFQLVAFLSHLGRRCSSEEQQKARLVHALSCNEGFSCLTMAETKFCSFHLSHCVQHHFNSVHSVEWVGRWHGYQVQENK